MRFSLIPSYCSLKSEMCGFQIIYPKGPTWLFLLERFESEIKDSYSAIKFANFGGVVELEGLHCV